MIVLCIFLVKMLSQAPITLTSTLEKKNISDDCRPPEFKEQQVLQV